MNEQTSSRSHYHVAANQGTENFRTVYASKAEAEAVADRYFGGRVLTHTRFTAQSDPCVWCAK